LELNDHRVAIDFFKKTITQYVVYIIEGFYDLLRQILVFEFDRFQLTASCFKPENPANPVNLRSIL
jgi:hypothetical protein